MYGSESAWDGRSTYGGRSKEKGMHLSANAGPIELGQEDKRTCTHDLSRSAQGTEIQPSGFIGSGIGEVGVLDYQEQGLKC